MTSKKENLKEFILKEANELLQTYNMTDLVDVKISSMPFKSDSDIKFSSDFNEAIITINLVNLLKSDKNMTKIYFNAYSTIAHEITHARLLFKDSLDSEFNFAKLMTILEYLYYGSYFKIDYKKIKLNPLVALNVQKLLNLNYDISSSELFANLEGYTKALDKYKYELSGHDIQTYIEIIESLEFLNKQMQIFYSNDKTVVNRFSVILLWAQKYIKQYPELLIKYPICTSVFNPNGSLIHPYSLFLKINDENKQFYDSLITNWIISFKTDITEYLKDEKFKKYLETLIKNYINETILYYKKIYLGQIFIKDEKILNDNLRFKKLAVVLLQEFAAFNNLNLEGGIVLDSSLMMSSENLVRTKSK